MLIYVRGSDAYLARQAINQLKAKYLAKNDGAELIEIASDQPNPNFADLAAVPLFATSRLVILKGVGYFDVLSQEKLTQALAGLPATTVAVLWDQKPLPAKSPLLSALAEAKVISAEPMGALTLRRWIQGRVKELGVTLDPAALESLLSAAGGDLWFLETELNYLATATGASVDDRHQKIQRPDDYFVYFRLVRARAWPKIAQQLTQDFQTGTPFELLLGSLAAAVRKEVSEKVERRRLVELMSDLDFATKTGLVELGEAIALLAHHLPNPAADRVEWEVIWEGVN